MTTFRNDLRELTAAARRLGVGAAAERLETAAARSDTFTALVVGEFKQGKSELLCALVGGPVSPSHVRLPTGPVVIVRHGDRDGAVLRGSGDDQTLEMSDLPRVLYEDAVWSGAAPVLDVTSTRWNLPTGVTLIDTPGGGLTSPSGVVVREIAPSCDAVLFVTDAARELTADERALLDGIRGGAAVLCVVTKIDLYPNWRSMVAVDTEHLRAAGAEIEVLPASAAVFAVAERGQPLLSDESGVPAVRRWLTQQFERAQASSELPLRHVAIDVVEELAAMATNELAALDPALREQSRQRLLSAKVAAERVLSGESLWLVELRDGISDVDRRLARGLEKMQHDLSRRAAPLIAESDPAQNWDEFASVFMNAVVEASTALYSDLTRELERAVQIAIRQFAVKAGEVVFEVQSSGLLSLPGVELAKARRQPMPLLDVADASWSKVETLQVIGMQARLTSPFGLLVAAFLGRRILRAKRGELLEGRRQQARAAVAEYLDELVLEQRDLMEQELRVVHDRVRDQLIERAEQAVKGWDEALAQLDAHKSMDPWSRDERIELLRETQVVIERMRTELVASEVPSA